MLDLLKRRRSIRRFKNKKIDKETLDIILKAALTSPTGRDLKPWSLLVVDKKERLHTLGKIRGGSPDPISNASLAIVVMGEPDVSDTWIEDCSIISTIIQVVSQSLGLGSCWVQIRNRTGIDKRNAEISVKEVLEIPENYKIECIIAIGYPDEEKPPHSLENLNYDKVKYNSFYI